MAKEVLSIKEFGANEILVKEGRYGREMYVLLKGVLEVSKDGIPIAKIDAKGSFIGEICALMETRRIATIKTLTPCKFYVIEDLSRYFAENPEAGFLMAKTLASRLIDMNQSFVNLKKALMSLSQGDFLKNANEDDRREMEQAIETIQKGLENDTIDVKHAKDFTKTLNKQV